MRLHRSGDTGRPVRDIQSRLSALGYACHPDPPGEFRERTRLAVVAFQHARGIAPDGIVGPDTWRNLVDATYRLGDRLLFYRRPMLRGDDVADLQRRLNALGFDAGKVDGIFGPDTQRALLDFQRNRCVAEDGSAGPLVIQELRHVARATSKTGREAVREREWIRGLPASIVGARIFVDPACRDAEEGDGAWSAASETSRLIQQRGGVPLLSRSADTRFPERVRVGRANRMGVDLIVSFQQPRSDTAGVYFFASTMSRSEAGALLASETAERLGVGVEGRAIPILKETRAPAIVVAVDDLAAGLGKPVVESIEAFFAAASAHLPDQGKNVR
jgi:N-acetylmuramoyl-L-alanine amidase